MGSVVLTMSKAVAYLHLSGPVSLLRVLRLSLSSMAD